jgi:hypothetical protein
VNDRVKIILDTHQPSPLQPEAVSKIEEILREAERRERK